MFSENSSKPFAEKSMADNERQWHLIQPFCTVVELNHVELPEVPLIWTMTVVVVVVVAGGVAAVVHRANSELLQDNDYRNISNYYCFHDNCVQKYPSKQIGSSTPCSWYILEVFGGPFTSSSLPIDD